jgi:hypothetical protein
MMVRARCADGPYAGQTFEFPVPYSKIHYSPSVYSQSIGPLAWIYNGTDRHCYQMISNGWYRGWRLVYRDTF